MAEAPHITEAELAILELLWQRKQATVKEIHEALSKSKDAGYTTTLKQMQVMLDKGLLKRDDGQRQHMYFPAVAEKKIRQKFTDKLMHSFFKGSATQLIMHALGEYKTTPQELEEIKALIEKVKKP